MKTYSLSGTLRTELGKTRVKKIRQEGLVPCALYSNGTVVHFAIANNELIKVLHTPDTYLVKLSIDGKGYDAIVKGANYHPVHDNVLHVEFLQVSTDKAVEVPLPIRLVGTSPGVLAGGKLVQKLKRMKVRGIYTNLPDAIEVDISTLKLGKSLKIRELDFPGFTSAMAGDVPVATIEIPRALRQEAAQQAKEATKKK